MKRRIKLTESDLHRVIKESVKKILKEHDLMPGDNGGYYSDSDFFNSENYTWRGVVGTKLIWHGEWSDYEVVYKGEVINGNELDNYAWSCYKEEFNSSSESEFDNLPSDWFAEVINSFCE